MVFTNPESALVDSQRVKEGQTQGFMMKDLRHKFDLKRWFDA